MKSCTCIYIIKSKLKPERFYIGSSVKYSRRKVRHTYELKHDIHSNEKLKRHAKKYGYKDLEFNILEVVENKFDLLSREQHYIDTMNPYFNLSRIAGSSIGVRHSEESRKNRSVFQTGRKIPECGRLNMSLSLMGNKNHLGKKHTKESRDKISKSRMGKYTGINNSSYKGKIAALKNGEIVDEYFGTIDCANKLNINPTGISSVLSGNRKTANGFTFIRV